MADILAIVGSTWFACPDGLAIARLVIVDELTARRPDTVTSGGAPGVDTIGQEAAERFGIGTDVFPPKVHRWNGRGGFKERNQKIADRCSRALRIVCAESTTYGSGWTCLQVQRQGKPVRTVVIDRGGGVTDSGWPDVARGAPSAIRQEDLFST